MGNGSDHLFLQGCPVTISAERLALYTRLTDTALELLDSVTDPRSYQRCLSTIREQFGRHGIETDHLATQYTAETVHTLRRQCRAAAATYRSVKGVHDRPRALVHVEGP